MDDTTSDMIFYGESGWLPRHNVTQYTRCGHYRYGIQTFYPPRHMILPPDISASGQFPLPLYMA